MVDVRGLNNQIRALMELTITLAIMSSSYPETALKSRYNSMRSFSNVVELLCDCESRLISASIESWLHRSGPMVDAKCAVERLSDPV